MARRRKATRRRRDNSIKLLNVAEGLVQANIVTDKLMGVDALTFALGDVVPGISSGGGISLAEIIRRPELLNTVGERAMNPRNLAEIAITSAVANFGFRFAKRALRRPVNMLNRQVFKPLALGVKL